MGTIVFLLFSVIALLFPVVVVCKKGEKRKVKAESVQLRSRKSANPVGQGGEQQGGEQDVAKKPSLSSGLVDEAEMNQQNPSKYADPVEPAGKQAVAADRNVKKKNSIATIGGKQPGIDYRDLQKTQNTTNNTGLIHQPLADTQNDCTGGPPPVTAQPLKVVKSDEKAKVPEKRKTEAAAPPPKKLAVKREEFFADQNDDDTLLCVKSIENDTDPKL